MGKSHVIFKRAACRARSMCLLVLIACASGTGGIETAGTAGAHGASASRECTPSGMVLLIALGEMERAPGAVDTLRVMASPGPWAFEPLPGECVSGWSLSAGAPATVDRAGVLRVAQDAADGASFAVAARVAGDDITATVRVVDPARNPLIGTWTEVAQISCGPEVTESTPADPIRELRFLANGRFTVTWLPFEAYVDYSGTFTWASGALRLEAERINYLPADLDLEGRAEITGNVLSLLDIWLGSREEGARRGCGMRFQRTGAVPPGVPPGE